MAATQRRIACERPAACSPGGEVPRASPSGPVGARSPASAAFIGARGPIRTLRAFETPTPIAAGRPGRSWAKPARPTIFVPGHSRPGDSPRERGEVRMETNRSNPGDPAARLVGRVESVEADSLLRQ